MLCFAPATSAPAPVNLSGHSPAVRQSPSQLARAALTAATERAITVSSFVRRMSAGGKRPSIARDGGAVRDCVETMGDTVDRLRSSVKEMELLGRYGSRSFKWHLSNVQTWVSAALTDENTCLESLSEDKSAAGVRTEIRRQIAGVSKLTSNALALVNKLDP
ncbi:hypothetical protein KSP39_PZI000831 [Platanthera zijinensis]|uniref:Pectinesterase inhibitor domain-containing protein n=1 Tax=Platanthera zijinensis TaxID=2320716 RepID=A0AAP0GFV6_9ASPA